MLVYWDANALASEHATGIVVYGANLLRALQKYDDLEFTGLIKLSRLKRRHFIPRHANIRTQIYVPPFSDWFLDRKAVYHGIDFKVPNTRRLPRVVTIHDLSVFEPNLSEPRFQQQGMDYNRYLINQLKPERIIVPTEFGKEHMLRHFPETRDKIRVIPHGADQVFLGAGTAAAGVPPALAGRPFILCPGSVEERKNGQRLIEAFENSRASKVMPLVFAGGRGYNHETIYARAAASPAKDSIVFLTGLSSAQLIALYKNATLTIYPSVFEGFGLPIVEAFALGSPLITSNIGAMAEVAGSAAMTVDPYSVAAMREAIDSLATDAARRSTLAEKGKLRAAQFTWQKAAAATRDVYLELAP
ncbi:MAG: glycosyltransferase family 4 protein [Spirochaetota bacterium]